MSKLMRRYFVVLDVEREEGHSLDRGQMATTIESGIEYISPKTNVQTTVYNNVQELIADAVKHAGPFSDG